MTSDSSYSSNTPDRDFNYTPADASEKAVAKGGVACPFPWRLHEMLKVAREEGLEHIVSWAPHGKAFTVHKPVEFAERVMKRFFCQTKFASFQRQLNLYGFARFCHGRDKGAYYHPYFIRGQRALVRRMIRRKIKGQAAILRRPLPTEEPDFYSGQPAMDCDGLQLETSGQVQHAANLIPSCVLVQQHNLNAEQSMAAPVPLHTSCDESSNNLNVDLFDSHPFLFVTDDHLTDPPVPQASCFDPAAELAKLRAQIRQKKAEYDQMTSSRRSSVSDSLNGFFMEEEQVLQEPQRQVSRECYIIPAAPTEPHRLVPAPVKGVKGIPVYKGSYISV